VSAAGTALPVVLVGCGAVARLYYAPALAELQRTGLIDVVSVVDADASARGVIAGRFHHARCVDDIDGLRPDGCRLAILASPPSLHAPQAIALLDRGIAVLCEKPMAQTTAEAAAMVAAADRSGAMLAVGLVRRHFPATRYIHSALAAGVAGALQSFRFSEGSADFRWPVGSPSYFAGRAGQGVLGDLGSHALDLLAWWFGEPDDIRCRDDACGGPEANAEIFVRYDGSGLGGTIRLSRDAPVPNRYVIRGDRGCLEWDVNDASGVAFTPAGATLALRGSAVPGAGTTLPYQFEHCFVEQLRDVVRAVAQGTAPRVTGRDGLAHVRLLERCLERREPLPQPWLSDVEAARWSALRAVSP
jgi:predicted dehydrogenase